MIAMASQRARERRIASQPKLEVVVVEDPNNVSVAKAEFTTAASELLNAVREERRKSDHLMKFLESEVKKGEQDLARIANGSFAGANLNDTVFGAETSFKAKPGSGFNATAYFNRSQNDLSTMFADVDDGAFEAQTQETKRRKSDYGLSDLSGLYGKRRKARLSEMFDNDPVMMYLKTPTLEEDIANLKEEVRKEKRNSVLLNERLKQIIQQ